MKEKFPDVARAGGKPSAAGYNARSRVLERLAAGSRRHSVHTDAFEAQREVQGQPPLLVRVIYDVVPKFVDDAVGPQLPPASGGVVFGDEPGDVDPGDEGPDVGAAPPGDVEEDPFDASFRDESEGYAQGATPPGTVPAQTGCNAAVLQWDEQEQEWFDTDEYLYVENPHNTVYDRDETALVLWHQASGSYAFAERSTWHYGLTAASPAGPPPASDFYPDSAATPDTYAVTFVSLPYSRHPGFNGVQPVPLLNGPHAVVQNVRPGAPYLPEGSLVLCRRQGGHWYIDEGEAATASGSGTGSGSGRAVACPPLSSPAGELLADPENGILWMSKGGGCWWRFNAAGFCCPASGSGTGTGTGTGTSHGGTVSCSGTPATLYLTIHNVQNLGCIDGVTVPLTFSGGAVWTVGSGLTDYVRIGTASNGQGVHLNGSVTCGGAGGTSQAASWVYNLNIDNHDTFWKSNWQGSGGDAGNVVSDNPFSIEINRTKTADNVCAGVAGPVVLKAKFVITT